MAQVSVYWTLGHQILLRRFNSQPAWPLPENNLHLEKNICACMRIEQLVQGLDLTHIQYKIPFEQSVSVVLLVLLSLP